MSTQESQAISAPQGAGYGSIPATPQASPRSDGSFSQKQISPGGGAAAHHHIGPHATHIHEGEFNEPTELITKREAGFKEGPGTGRASQQEEPFQWEMRGKAFGLILSDLVPVGMRLFLLMAILGALWAEPRWQHPCPSGNHVSATYNVYLCEYTKAYVLCFPEAAISVLLMLGARNIFQKRFYYGLLKRGGVIEYGSNSPIRDPLVLFLLWCYCHILLFMGLILFGVIEAPEMAAEGSREEHHDPEEALFGLDPGQLAVVMSLASFIALPGAFVVMYIYGSYDIEMSLVPLSGYIEAQGSSAKAEAGVKMLASLQIFEDKHAKLLIEKYAQSFNDTHQASGLHAMYMSFLQLYPQLKGNDEPSSVKLLGSLWMARILGKDDPATTNTFNVAASMSNMESGMMDQVHSSGKESAVAFKWLWRVFLGSGVAIFAALVAFFCVRVYGLALRALAGTLGFQTVSVVLVEILHLFVIILVFWKLITCQMVGSGGAVPTLGPMTSGGGGLMSSMPGQGVQGAQSKQRMGPDVGSGRSRGRGRGNGATSD